jgi:hypothetical protein
MSKINLVLFLSFFLAGCVVVATATIKPNQIYRGYPCGDTCAAFQAGYDQAEATHLTESLQCAVFSLDQAAGCQAYLHEYARTRPTFTDLTFK